jgi:hypothetical protein
VRANGVGVAVPPIGSGVSALALRADGAEVSLTVETDAWGRAWIIEQRVSMRSGPAGTTPIAECTDNDYRLLPYWQHGTFRWKFRKTLTPDELTQGGAESVLKTSMNNITGARNNCGRSDRIDADATYKGDTDKPTNISPNSACLDRDTNNTVSFGDLADNHLGLTCDWYVGDRIKESDVRFNKHDFEWSLHKSGCSGSMRVLQNTATHEFGHVWGLGHVGGAAHTNLTMYPSSGPCDAFKTTLALGDLLGLERRY